MPITRLLIANRGEIAVRIARTCRELGIASVGVFSDADAGALHVDAVDEAARLRGSSPAETYLAMDAVLAAAERTGADAIHPGYGFLAENAEFARRVTDGGLVWVGPSPDAIAAMGDKIEAKRRMAEAGVPLLRGAAVGADDDVAGIGAEVGFPLMVKAAAGGGGKGMRIVRDPSDLETAAAAASREAANAFGDGRVFLERYVERPRHIEIQVIGDHHGNVVHLFERECSVQRRHQKVLEETPSPVLDERVRGEMGAAAVAAAAAIGYHNAGTVEFIAETDADGAVTGFAFLEMNTRLQVEHPVTELVTGWDLVRLQLLVAAGARLPFTQDEVASNGHAIEVRLYAEDPANDHLPATGTLELFRPPGDAGIRWDTGVREGSEISTHYDPMLAKVIARAPTRDEAARRLAHALARTGLGGVTTNRDLLVAILRDEDFLTGRTTTAFLEERFGSEGARRFTRSRDQVELAAIAGTVMAARERQRAATVNRSLPIAFTNDPHARRYTSYQGPDGAVEVHYRVARDGTFRIWLGDEEHVVAPAGDRAIEIDGRRLPVEWFQRGLTHHVILPAGHVAIDEIPRFPQRREDDVPGATRAPMPGTVVTVAVEEGQEVAKGDLLVALEAMKMEHRITAPFDGTVTEVAVAEGDQVDAEAMLVVVEDGGTAVTD